MVVGGGVGAGARGGGGGGWIANKINELALVEGNLPSSLVRVPLYSLKQTRQRGTSCFHPTNLVD